MKRILKRFLLALALLLLVLVVGGASWLYWRTHACLPQLDGVLQVPGLAARVEVLRDARGVPHLRAQSLEDLLFAQGYVTAQDRLWQMDLSRRLAEGELSEIFGERTLRFDIENRTLGFRQACERAVAELDTDTRKLLAAYARGVNAFISAHRDRFPVEFLLLRYQPRPWREADSFAVAANIAQLLGTSWPDDLMRERIRAKLGEELSSDLFPDRSALDQPVAELPTAPAASPPKPQVSSTPDFADLDPVLAAVTSVGSSSARSLGSNNWVLAGSYTQSGKPLLANDPHLGHSIPSVWYMIHLKAPGLDATGVSFPGMPAVILGHNERIAWGATNTGPDVQDLYVESFNFRDSNKYLHNAEWVEAAIRNEVIKVRGKRDYHFTVKLTRHGPVISHDGDRDLALRWTALEPRALHFPFLRINRAKNWEEFVAALRDFSGPQQNFIFADVDGNIGFYAAGWVPIRKQGNGSVPVPGSTDDYDWTGYIPFEGLPHAYNPSEGIIATANGRVVPDGYPYLITSKWEAPYRTVRIYQLLRAGSAFTVPDMLRIQMDIHSLDDEWLAKQLVSASFHHAPQSDDARFALSLLVHWDGEARTDSAPTLVCEVTRRALLERLLKPKLGANLAGYSWPMSTTFLENVLTNQWTRWLPPGDASFGETLVKSLEEGVKRIPKLVGSHSDRMWQWGETIPLTFQHPLSGGFPLLRRLLDVGPFPQAGTETTVRLATSNLGPSMRMVVDFSNFDSSVQNITLGESGQVFSPYYRDQFDAWYNGRSFPMLFSDSAVERGAVHKLVLEPALRQ